MRADQYDPETLDKRLAELCEAANAARVAFILGQEDEGRKQFEAVIHAVAEAVHQISLLNRK